MPSSVVSGHTCRSLLWYCRDDDEGGKSWKMAQSELTEARFAIRVLLSKSLAGVRGKTTDTCTSHHVQFYDSLPVSSFLCTCPLAEYHVTDSRVSIKDEAVIHVVRWVPPGWQQQRQQRNATHSHLPAALQDQDRPMRSQCEAKPKPNEKADGR